MQLNEFFIPGLNEAPKPQIEQLRDILAGKQAMPVKFADGSMRVDAYTASAVVQVYDAVSSDTQEKINSMLQHKAGLAKLADFAFSRSKTSEAASVDSTSYQWSHGKAPKGGGSWFFVAHRGGVNFSKDVEGKDYIVVHGATYSDAKKAALKWAKEQGHTQIYVGEDVEEGKSENRDLWDKIKSKGVVPSIDRERYTDLSDEGLEGPFRMKNGQVLYYDPKEGKYYDRDTDMYVDYDDYRAMNEMDKSQKGPPGWNISDDEPGKKQIHLGPKHMIKNKDMVKKAEKELNKAFDNTSLKALARHVKEGVPLCDSLFRYMSEGYFEVFNNARKLREAGSLPELDWESEEMLASDIGQKVRLKGLGEVYLDVPYMDESSDAEGNIGQMSDEDLADYIGVSVEKVKADRDAAEEIANSITADHAEMDEAEYHGKSVQLNKPKRGGSKKYYVYVKNPKTGKIKKISFGDVTGLRTKSGNAARARSFAARHNCEKKNDKTKAGYWACRLPRYGLVKGGKWW